MKKSNMMIAIVMAGLCGQIQSDYGSFFTRELKREQDIRNAKILGVGTLALIGLPAAANLYMRLFPRAPEAIKIQQGKWALVALQHLERDVRAINFNLPSPDINNRDRALREATDNGIRDKDESQKTIQDMLNLIDGLRKDVYSFIRKNTEELKKRNELKKKGSWTDWWYGRTTT